MESFTTTMWNIIDSVLEELWVSRGNPSYPDSLIRRKIKEGERRILNKRTYNDRIGRISFVKPLDTSVVGPYNSTYIPIPKTSTELWLDPNTPGRLIIKDTVVLDYSSIDDVNRRIILTEALTEENYRAGDKIQFLFDLNQVTNIKKVSEVIAGNFVLYYTNSKEYAIENLWPRQYTLIDQKWLAIPYSSQNRDINVTVNYVKDFSSALENDTDIVQIEDEYTWVLVYYALYTVARAREDERAEAFRADYIEMLEDFRNYKSKIVDGVNNKLQLGVIPTDNSTDILA